MYIIDVFFRYHTDCVLEQGRYLINQIIDQWRYNGQIIGREIPLYLAEQENQLGFAARVICPQQHSLLPELNNIEVDRALEKAESAGVFSIIFKWLLTISILTPLVRKRPAGNCFIRLICILALRYTAATISRQFRYINR